MFRLILKTLWARRKRNGWLLAELILVAVLSWAIFDPVIVLTHNRLIPLGYDADRLVLVSLDMLRERAPGYDPQATDSAAIVDAYLNLVRLAREHPDVQQTTAVLGFSYPNSDGNSMNSYRAEGDTTRNGRISSMIIQFLPHTHFFETYGFRPGKGLSPAELSDRDYGLDDLVLDEGTLQALFSTDDPRGKRVWDYYESDTTRSNVVGTVGIFKFRNERCPVSVVFQPSLFIDTGYLPNDIRILVRVKEGVSMDRFLHEFRPWMLQHLRAGNLYARDLRSYDQVIDEQETDSSGAIYRRNLLVAVFFLVNLCLGVVGTFWLQTRTRREEVGVMLSFGATPGRIVRQLLGEGAVLTTLGTLVGCFIYLQYAISEGLAKGVSDWMGKVQTYWTDSFGLHFLIVSLIVYAILLAVVSVGVYIPARKISRIPPTEALRDE